MTGWWLYAFMWYLGQRWLVFYLSGGGSSILERFLWRVRGYHIAANQYTQKLTNTEKISFLSNTQFCPTNKYFTRISPIYLVMSTQG